MHTHLHINIMHMNTDFCFVYSESSMFVSQNRFILKTCGTTTPLQCLEPLLMLVKQYAGFNAYEVCTFPLLPFMSMNLLTIFISLDCATHFYLGIQTLFDCFLVWSCFNWNCAQRLHVFFQDVFYSRKNFKRPDLQKSPHRSFTQEVELLNAIFKGKL